MPNGVLHNDEFFGEQVVYYNEMVARATIQRATPEAMNLELEFEYQGCADEGLCYPPQTVYLLQSYRRPKRSPTCRAFVLLQARWYRSRTASPN